ncbi:MAG: sulfite exporter TauE/SafE family protein [Bacteroidota bacterium]
MQPMLAGLSGAFSGLSLGLIGGGGSVLAVPMLVYLVGVANPHVAIGTSALAVALSAFANLIPHARAGNVRWRTALIFAAAGMTGAWGGSTLGKALDGGRLLFLFALVMMTVALLMLRPRRGGAKAPECLRPQCLARVGSTAAAVGGLAGFFGIGGGFLVVPGLLFSTGMPMIEAVGTSLVAVGGFGIATAANYAISGLVDWAVAAQFIAGGLVGGWGGVLIGRRLARSRGGLNIAYAVMVFSVGVYVLVQNLHTLG